MSDGIAWTPHQLMVAEEALKLEASRLRFRERLDDIAKQCWTDSKYSGRDGQDFDHVKLATMLLEAERLNTSEILLGILNRYIRIHDSTSIELRDRLLDDLVRVFP